MAKLEVTLISQNVSINAIEPVQNAILNVKDIVMASSAKLSDLVSGDTHNELKFGSDGKLAIKTDELKTSFDFSETVKTVWSI